MAEHFCEVCNTEVPEGALACPMCGTPVSKPAQKEAGGPAADIPAAPPEYIDLAEVTIPSGELPVESQTTQEQSPFEDIPADILAVADESITPGVVIPPETVQITSDHIGGYKEAMAGPSVAGAGNQTADDPFGLQITESAPAFTAEEEGGFDFEKLKNIVMLIFSFLLIAGVITLGVWFFVIRKAPPKIASPQNSIEQTLVKVFAGSNVGIDKYADPNSQFVSKANAVFAPYRELGMLTLNKLEIETNIQGTKATVTITKFNVELTSDQGKELLDVLTITQPYPCPTVIYLEKKNNRWVIVN